MNHKTALSVGFAAIVFIVFQIPPASAQKIIPIEQAQSIARSRGLDPLGRPVRRGQNYVLRAIDIEDREVTVTIRGRDGRIISMRPTDERDDANIIYEALPADAEGRIIYVPRSLGTETVPKLIDPPPRRETSRQRPAGKSARSERKRPKTIGSHIATRPAAGRRAPTISIDQPARTIPAVPPAGRAESPSGSAPAIPAAPAKAAEPETTATTPRAPIRSRAVPKSAHENSSELAVSPRRRIIDPNNPEGASYPAQPPGKD